jgi:hypothetical protein
MSANLSSTTPAAPAGSVNITWQTASGNTSGYISATSLLAAASIVTKTANYTVTSSDRTLLGNATGGAFTLTLPASPTTGQQVIAKKIDTSANAVTVSGNGKSIDSGSSLTLDTPNQSYSLQYDGTQWWIL